MRSNRTLVAHAQNALKGKSEFVSKKLEIKENIRSYMAAMGSLTAIMGGELLRHAKDEDRLAILSWLWDGDIWKRHEDLSGTRVANTATWILGRPEFLGWQRGEPSRHLICHGMRNKSSYLLPS